MSIDKEKDDIKSDIIELKARYETTADAGARKELAWLIRKKEQKLQDVEFQERLRSNLR